MRIRRKVKTCLNCNRSMGEVYNYCPNCGQENNNNDVSFWRLTVDFIANYFALDSKFTNTFLPFFIKPGLLTNEYIKGRRASYANPVRLYLVISLFFFFMFSLITLDKLAGTISNFEYNNNGITSRLLNQSELVSKNLPDSVIEKVQSELKLNPEASKEVKAIIQNLDSISITPAAREAKTNQTIAKSDTTTKQNKPENKKQKPILQRIDWKLLAKLENTAMSDVGILDSMHLGELSFLDRHIARQTIRVSRSNKKQIISYILKNLPIMMFLLVPLFALILKIIYFRHKNFYIHHTVHALHLHSFAYLCYGLSLLIITIAEHNFSNLNTKVGFLSFVIVSTYAFFSFKRVYPQSWLKALIKFNLVGLSYLFLICMFFIAEIGLSILFY